MGTKDYWLALSCVEGLGWRRLELLLEYFGSVERAWKSEPSMWLSLGVDRRVVASFERVRERRPRVEEVLGAFSFCSYRDRLYPPALRDIASPPIGLFYEGDISIIRQSSVAVIGTRRMSSYGEKVTRQFVAELVRRGLVIVSGLAHGVDGVAHEMCLSEGGKTIAVVAHGLDMTYPKDHETLRRRIVAGGGLVVSEYPFGVLATPQRFVVRNRIVSGLSSAVVVCEAPKKSGTKITVGFAAEQGKDVYVIPGPIDLFSYVGSHEIIRDGGIPVSSPDEIAV